MGEQSRLRYTRRVRLFSQFSRTAIDLYLIPANGQPFQLERAVLAILTFLGEVAPAVLTVKNENASLVDIRGRPRESFDSPPLGLIDEKMRREELLAIAGKFLTSDDAGKVERRLEESDRFLVQVLSRFDSFRGPQHIVHSCNRTLLGLSDDVAERFALKDLGYLFPLRLTECRLGLELYRSRFRGSMLSFAAGIEQRLYLELSTASATLRYSDDYSSAGKPSALLNPNEPLGRAMKGVVETSLGFSGLFTRLTQLECSSGGKLELAESIGRQ